MPASSRRSWAPQRVIIIIVGIKEVSKKIKKSIKSEVVKARRVVNCKKMLLVI